jgi:hypothetical protein
VVVTEQQLQRPQIDPALEAGNRKRMPQHVRRYLLE